ncbi:SDH family Clp fold serine proteinase [Acidimangrovimonas pyrenivorans]|uniref:ATP-dependent Clp protease proteolytic subunit n=1 Tax=Acidimangrovimonas pyrenivorans TaxID=2030798 RepID=A0ABV7AKC3_9RHOB
MSIMDLFWIFILVSALQPMLRQRLLEFQRASFIDRMQRKRGSRVILMVHRQETMRFLGFPLARYIDVHDSEEVLRAIQMTDPEMPLDIVLHTPGGLVLAALQIARAVEAHKGPVTVFVPHHAMSGGTLIALAADQIVLSPHAVLGPVDPQIGQMPAASILSAVTSKPVEEIDDETLILADVGRKALIQVETASAALLAGHMEAEKAREVAHLLASGTWTHDYPIPAEEAAAMGLPVSTEMPEEILRLMRLYPQPVRQQGGVEYLPLPRMPKRNGKN